MICNFFSNENFLFETMCFSYGSQLFHYPSIKSVSNAYTDINNYYITFFFGSPGCELDYYGFMGEGTRKLKTVGIIILI